MNPADFAPQMPGRLVPNLEGCHSFVPAALPPEIALSWELLEQVVAAEKGISRLAGLVQALPNPKLLVQPFINREAVLSSRIEGTVSGLDDVLQLQATGRVTHARSDALEVSNCAAALRHGLCRLGELPLCIRLLREMHSRLFQGLPGTGQPAGEFRSRQNWIGTPGTRIAEARYVPPPPDELPAALAALERFWNEPPALPLVVRLALAHYQFEAIHPFADGNGRIGRLLISLQLCAEQAMPEPLLHISAYLERRREEYYRLLLAVSQRGAWLPWMEFFAQGMAEEAADALTRTQRLLDLWQGYRRRLQTARSSALLLKLVDRLFEKPVFTVPETAEFLGVTYRAASLNIEKLVCAGMVQDVSLDRDLYPWSTKMFRAAEIVALLERPHT